MGIIGLIILCFISIEDIKYQLKQLINKYNTYRPHQKLGNLTPK
jgi:transposase InsO family protein